MQVSDDVTVMLVHYQLYVLVGRLAWWKFRWLTDQCLLENVASAETESFREFLATHDEVIPC